MTFSSKSPKVRLPKVRSPKVRSPGQVTRSGQSQISELNISIQVWNCAVATVNSSYSESMLLIILSVPESNRLCHSWCPGHPNFAPLALMEADIVVGESALFTGCDFMTPLKVRVNNLIHNHNRMCCCTALSLLATSFCTKNKFSVFHISTLL